MVVVLVLLLILGAVIIPSLSGYYGNTKQRAATDLFRTRLAEARAKAMERGIPFRVAIMKNTNSVRVAPDGDTFDSLPADDPPSPDSQVTEDKFESEVSFDVILDPTDDRNTPSPGGWTTIVTMKANGDSKETLPASVVFKQSNYSPIQIQVRGLTGQVRTLTGSAATATNTNGSQP
jgi:type II secretory pathway pseudopilin PulG